MSRLTIARLIVFSPFIIFGLAMLSFHFEWFTAIGCLLVIGPMNTILDSFRDDIVRKVK